MTSTDSITQNHSPAPWGYECNPYTMSKAARLANDDAEIEIPAFEICDADGDKIFDTNEDSPAELQEANARLAAAAPELLAALEYFYNIMRDYENSVEKGYVEIALDMARDAIAVAKEQ